MLKPLFHYSFDDFCERYNISTEYVLDKLTQKYPLLKEGSDLLILLNEVDLLILIGLGKFDDLTDEDIRREAYIKINPRY